LLLLEIVQSKDRQFHKGLQQEFREGVLPQMDDLLEATESDRLVIF
jgi:hypothetical protein